MNRIVIILALLSGAVTANAKSSLDLPKAFAGLTKISMETLVPAERDKQIAAILDPVQSEVEKIGVSRLADDDINEYFEVAHLGAAYTLKPSYANMMRRATDEMVRRKMDVTAKQPTLLKIYVATRMLDEARDYATLIRGGAPALPRFDDEAFSSGPYPTLWYVSGDAQSVLRYSFPLDEGVKVVVSGHPWCHFSQRAAKDIENSSKIAELMERYAVWVVPQHPMPNFSDIAQWNAQYPHLHMRVVYEANEWRDIANWATPVFYFFKDGRLIDTVTGWQDAKQSDRLVEAFHAVGVE